MPPKRPVTVKASSRNQIAIPAAALPSQHSGGRPVARGHPGWHAHPHPEAREDVTSP